MASTQTHTQVDKAPVPASSSAEQQREACSCGNPDCTCRDCHCAGNCQCGKQSTGDKIKTKLDHGLMAVGVKKDTRPHKPSDAAWETMEQAERDMQRRQQDEEREGQRVAQDAATETARGPGTIGAADGSRSEATRIQKAGVIGSQAAADAKTAMDRQQEDQRLQQQRAAEDARHH